MDILVIGGSGNISYNFVIAAIEAGHQVTTITRGYPHPLRRLFSHERKLDVVGDARSENGLAALLGDDRYYDVVVNFVCYHSQDAQASLRYFSGRAGKYLFISTTAGYSKDPKWLPYDEKTPFDHLDWRYARHKAEAEHEFMAAYERMEFPVSIIRLPHTYDVSVPVAVGPADWTIPHRILQGKPVIVHGDGTTIWSLLHAKDAASAILGLTMNDSGISQIINIASEERFTWRCLTEKLATALGVEANIHYLPTQSIAAVSSWLGDGLYGHKMWNDFYNTHKLRNILKGWSPSVGLDEGLGSTIDWYWADPERRQIGADTNVILDNMCAMA